MSDSFKSIVLFGSINEKTANLMNDLKTNPGLQVFKTNSEEEISQIIAMSIRTAVVFDEYEEATERTFHCPGLYRKYYLSWVEESPYQFQKLRSMNVYPIKTSNRDEIFSKLELYLYGKVVNLFKNPGPYLEAIPLHIQQGTKALLSCIENQDGWKTTISTHMQEEDINSLLGISWDEHVEAILSNVDLAGKLVEKKSHGKFREFIRYHGKDNVLTKVIVVHIQSEDEVILDKVRKFLIQN
jgi:hypothetical protein